jgi:CheY-like chemotaxis protein
MATPEVLICDPDLPSATALAQRFEKLGWSVHTASDEAEAGYRLLLWNIPSELPKLAILRLPEARDLLEFCTILSQEQVVELLPVIGLFERLEGATEQAFTAAGVIPILRSDDNWPAIRDVLIQLGLHAPHTKRVDQIDDPIKQEMPRKPARRPTKKGPAPSGRKSRGTPSDDS